MIYKTTFTVFLNPKGLYLDWKVLGWEEALIV